MNARWALWMVRREATWRPGWVSWRTAGIAAATGFFGHHALGPSSWSVGEIVLLVGALLTCSFGLWQRARADAATAGALVAGAGSPGTSALRTWNRIRAAVAGLQSAALVLLGSAATSVTQARGALEIGGWGVGVLAGLIVCGALIRYGPGTTRAGRW